MTAVILSPDRDFAALASSLNERMVRKLVVVGVNRAGRTFREKLPVELEQQLGARRIRSRTRAQAAFGGSATPRYRLALPKYVAPHDIKSLTFKRGRKGRQTRSIRVSFKDWSGKRLWFSPAKKEGKGRQRRIRLLEAGALPARHLGGVRVSRRILTDKTRFPGPAAVVDDARTDATAAMAAQLNKMIARRRG